MTLVIKSDKYQVAVKGNEAVLRQILQSDFGAKYIPAYSVIETDNVTDIPILELVEGNELNFTFNYPKAQLVFSAEQDVSIRDFISVIDYCLDYERQKHGIYTIHGSACAKDDKGIIFFGPVNGLGKTSLLLNLCGTMGFEFIGDEKILLSKEGMITGGVTTIEFNKKVLYQIADNRLHNHDTRSEELFKLAKMPVKVALIVQPMIIPGAKLIVDEWDVARADWHLYEELTRKIRGISRRISKFSYSLPSIDDTGLAQQRIKDAAILSKHVKFCTVRGDLKQVTAKIAKIIDHYE